MKICDYGYTTIVSANKLRIVRRFGMQILTVFLYLNDVEAGGGTNFPALDLVRANMVLRRSAIFGLCQDSQIDAICFFYPTQTIMPKRGRALLWPSVLDEDPDEPDERTEHQALPVERGMKYGA